MERGSVNGKTSVGAPSHSRTPGQTTSNLIMCPGLGTGVRLRPVLTITKVVIPANYIQGMVLVLRLDPTLLSAYEQIVPFLLPFLFIPRLFSFFLLHLVTLT